MSRRNNDWDYDRKKKKAIPEGKNILLIYCGQCTEPNYFHEALKIIKENFKKKSSNITDFTYEEEVIAKDPKNMAKSVQKVVKGYDKVFDEVYVVFEKDSFKNDNFDNAIHIVESLNQNRNQTDYISLWSNQCIELWFILHFEYLQSRSDRKDYFVKLKKHLHLNHKYGKNNPDIYKLVSNPLSRIDYAILNANKLFAMSKDETSYSKKFPATNIVYFFIKYRKYLGK